MTLDHEHRARLAAAKAEIAEIMAPERKDRAAKRRAYRKDMAKRVGKRGAGQKQPRERNAPFLAFVRRQPCAVAHLGGCSGPIEAAHVRYSDASKGIRNPGMGAKNHDRHCNPLCRFHHQGDQHQRKEQRFWAEAGIDAYDNAARLFDEFQAGRDQQKGGL